MQRHETDAISFAFGVIFVVVGGLFVTGEVDAFDFVSIWALPGALLATGSVLAAAALSHHRRTIRSSSPASAEESDPILE